MRVDFAGSFFLPGVRPAQCLSCQGTNRRAKSSARRAAAPAPRRARLATYPHAPRTHAARAGGAAPGGICGRSRLHAWTKRRRTKKVGSSVISRVMNRLRDQIRISLSDDANSAAETVVRQRARRNNMRVSVMCKLHNIAAERVKTGLV
jgi:hypothetical protein